jgi:fido (protein-threonine AMPylation protein)
MDDHHERETNHDILLRSDQPSQRTTKRRVKFDDKENTAKNDNGGTYATMKKKKRTCNDCSNADETTKKPRKEKKAKITNAGRGITLDAVESLVTFAQASGKERPSLAKDLVVRIRLEDLHGESSTIPRLERPAHDQTLLATLDDGRYSLPIFVVNDPDNEGFQDYLAKSLSLGDTADWVCLSVKGLVTTDGHNPKFDLGPIICLTQFEILSKIEPPCSFGIPYCSLGKRQLADLPRSPTNTQQCSKALCSSTARVRAGTIGTFLDRSLPFMTMEEVVRCHDTNVQRLLLSESPFVAPTTTADDNKHRHVQEAVSAAIAAFNQLAEQVQTFLTRHTALMTLQISQPTEHTVQNYVNAMREFASSQLDRQKASLASNAGREPADRATLITQQYNLTLEQAMRGRLGGRSQQKDILTTDRLLLWHSTLLKDLHPEAGQIRTKTVRAGNTVFTRPKDIVSEMDKFCNSLTRLQQHLQINGGTQSASSNAWQVILFAAVAMYGVVDIHPFADGNGRMSRIVANWALKSFPFTINLFATAAQRAEYILALETTRHLLSLTNEKKTCGAVSSHDILQIAKSVGIFAPLVRLLMDRVGRAVVEFNRVWQDKLGLAAEALECRAARQARERAKEGTCLICLDEGPNIATLCCGNAVHLNCIAEWLSGKNSCPNCRSEMPSISGRVVRAARNGFLNDEQQRTGATVNPSSRRLNRRYFQNAQDVIVSLLNNYSQQQQNTTTETAEDGYDSGQGTTAAAPEHEDDDDEGGTEHRFSSGEDDEASESSSSDEDEDSYADENSSSVASVDSVESQHHQSDVVANYLSEDNTDASSGVITSRVHQFCDALYCRNRPAIDCANSLCGRCCVLGGQFHCPRHNS